MKVALVHDDLVQWGGAERVLFALSEIFPEAPIYTTVFNSENPILYNNFKRKKIITSFIQNIYGWKNFYKVSGLIHPIAFEQFDFSEFDLVISQTTRFAKAVITKPKTVHICYMHTPPRFLWNFSGEKMPTTLFPYLSYMRIFDRVFSRRVDHYLAGSQNSQKRIKKIYNVDSKILYPFVDIEDLEKYNSFDGNYFLIISRLNKYKKVDVAIQVFNNLDWNLKIVGIGPELGNLKRLANSNIDFLESVEDNFLFKIISGCKALIVTAEEDFGLASLEAQALGKPVICYGKGGVKETVINKQTGLFFEEQTVDSLERAMKIFESLNFKVEDCKTNAKKFSKSNFKKRVLDYVNQFV